MPNNNIPVSAGYYKVSLNLEALTYTLESFENLFNGSWKVASEEMYAAEQGAAGADAGAQQGEPEASDAQGDNVEDVDFEEVK